MELRRLSELMKYQRKLKRFLDKNLIDIIFFGSFVKGGSAKDIDLALVVREKKNIAQIQKDIRNIVKSADIQVIDIESIYSPLWLTLIKEGFSIKRGKYLSELYNIEPAVLYRYSLKKLNNVQKVQFARGIKYILEKEGVVLTRSVVLMPLNKKNKMVDFLKTWGIYYESQEYELLPILRKETFF